MRALVAVLLLAPAAAFAERLPVAACVKWSKDIPEAQAAGEASFASFKRVEGKGPFPGCGVVAETESFGVGWLMRAWMKEDVLSPCGERLGGYTVRYKGEEWQAKLVSGLREFLTKNPKALERARACVPPAPAAAPAAAAPPAVSTAPLTPSLPAEPVTPSTGTK